MKSKSKKILAIVVTSIIVSGVVTACSSSDNENISLNCTEDNQELEKNEEIEVGFEIAELTMEEKL